jgi:hypothetical protein
LHTKAAYSVDLYAIQSDIYTVVVRHSYLFQDFIQAVAKYHGFVVVACMLMVIST